MSVVPITHRDIDQHINNLNPETCPMTMCDYYKWLEETKPTNIHTIETKKQYLETFGFNVGVDVLKERTIKNLKYIEQYYFDRYLRKRITEED